MAFRSCRSHRRGIGEDSINLVHEAKFYDYDTLGDFNGTLRVIAYVVQADGFEVVDEAKKIWSATVQATGD